MIKKLIVLDTETTGLEVDQGHRIIEIGAVLLEDRKKTDQHFHTYLNPQRAIDEEAQKVHGISNEKVKTNLNSLRLQKAFWSLSRAVF